MKHNETVLLIDDVPFNHALYRKALGRNVVIATNMLEAFIQMNQSIPNTIIVNHELMNGECNDFCRVIKDNPVLKSVPVIAVISDHDERAMRHVVESGYDHYVLRREVGRKGFLASTLRKVSQNL